MISDELKKYIERHKGWQDKSIEQMSIANNYLLAISTGLLAYSFNCEKAALSKLTFCMCNSVFDTQLALCFLSISFFFLSVMTGVFVLISRLYDFRLTRHITYVRKCFFKENEINYPKNAKLPDNDFENPNFLKRVESILKVLFKEIEFLNSKEMKSLKEDFPISKFNKIRELSFVLGTISWKWTKMQGLYLLIGIIFYGFYYLSN
jgi:hypothetical protein